VKDLALPNSKLPFDFSVSISTKEKLAISIACFNCLLVYHDVTYLVDLICLPFLVWMSYLV